MTRTLRLRVAEKVEELRRIAEAAEALGEEEGWSRDVTYAVVLSLEEVATNVVSHGGGGSDAGGIRVDITSSPEEVRVEMQDGGRAFDPFREAPMPDVNAGLQDREIGGLGIHFVKALMDETSYRRSGGRNHVTMVKRRH